MTVKDVLCQGFRTRREHGNAAKLTWYEAQTLRRFMDLPWFLEARRIDLKAANRRYLRRMGMPFRTRRAATR